MTRTTIAKYCRFEMRSCCALCAVLFAAGLSFIAFGADTLYWTGAASNWGGVGAWTNSAGVVKSVASGDTLVIEHFSASGATMETENDLEGASIATITVRGTGPVRLFGNAMTLTGNFNVNTIVTNDIGITLGTANNQTLTVITNALSASSPYLVQNGDITGTTAKTFTVKATKENGAASTALVFNGDIILPNATLQEYFNGDRIVYFNGRVVLDWLDKGRGAGDSGKVYWNNSGNDIANFLCQYKYHYASAVNCFGTNVVMTLGRWESTRGNIFMERYDQQIDRFELESRYRSNNGNGHYVFSTAPVRLTMRATADSICDVAFQNKVTVIWDPVDDYEMTCVSNRTHGTTGAIVVSNGTMRVTGTGSFKNAGEIEIAPNATFAWDSTALLGFSSATNLIMGAGAVFSLGAGATFPFANSTLSLDIDETSQLDIGASTQLSLSSFKVGGMELASGAYTGIDNENPGVATPHRCLRGTGIIYAPGGGGISSYVWTGAGSGNLLSTDGNWKDGSAPGMSEYLYSAVFAELAAGAPARAELDANSKFSGISFTAPDGFTLAPVSAANPATLFVGSEGIVISPAEGATSPAYAIETPFSVGLPQTWNLGTSAAASLSIAGPISGTSAMSVTIEGAAPLALHTTNSTYMGDVVIRNAGVRAYGKNPLGVNGDAETRVFIDRIGGGVSTSLTFEDVDCEKDIYNNCDASHTIGLSFAGSTNILRGDLSSAGCYDMTVPSGTTVILAGGFGAKKPSAYQRWKVYGKLVVTNKPFSAGTMECIFPGKMEIRVAGNQFSVLGYYVDSGSRQNEANFDFFEDWAFNLPSAKIIVRGTWNLNGHPQRVGSMYAPSSTMTIASDAAGGVLHVNQAESSVCRVSFTGAASLVKSGAAAMVVMANSTSTGMVSVAGGLLSFTNSASWTAASQVVVTNGSVLECWNTSVFGRDAEVKLGSDDEDAAVWRFGSAESPVAGVQTIGRLWSGGKRLPVGRYCASDNAAAIDAGARPCVRIVGSAVVDARGDGTGLRIIIR